MILPTMFRQAAKTMGIANGGDEGVQNLCNRDLN
jgi:hypothetical protein